MIIIKSKKILFLLKLILEIRINSIFFQSNIIQRDQNQFFGLTVDFNNSKRVPNTPLIDFFFSFFTAFALCYSHGAVNICFIFFTKLKLFFILQNMCICNPSQNLLVVFFSYEIGLCSMYCSFLLWICSVQSPINATKL